MIKKTVTYNDFNGKSHTEDFYFNLTKAELLEMESSVSGGYSSMLEGIVQAKDNHAIVNIVKEILLKAYGKRSDDGKLFMKTPEIRQELEFSNAFPEIYFDILSDEDKASEFINALVPNELLEEVNKQTATSTPELSSGSTDHMSREDLQAALDKLKNSPSSS